MPKYNTTYHTNDTTFVEIQRRDNVVIFEGTCSYMERKQYEVHVLRRKQSRLDSPDAGTVVLSSPSTSEWGQGGFTHVSLGAAQECLEKLADKYASNIIPMERAKGHPAWSEDADQDDRLAS